MDSKREERELGLRRPKRLGAHNAKKKKEFSREKIAVSD